MSYLFLSDHTSISRPWAHTVVTGHHSYETVMTRGSAGLADVWALFEKICGGPTSVGDLCQTFGG